MSHEATLLGTMKYTIDPNDAYVGVMPTRIYEAMGLLPRFAVGVHLSGPEDMEEACDMLSEQYGYGSEFNQNWGHIDEKGVYTSKYEEDPQLDPIGVFELTDTLLFYVYQSAIVGVYDTESKTSKMARMD